MDQNVEKLGFIHDMDLPDSIVSMLNDDIENPDAMEASSLHKHVLDKYGVDISASYGGIDLHHPFGKAAGQLSMSHKHVTSDRANGLAFTVLKSAVGVTEDGELGIDDWAMPAPKMMIKQRVARDGRTGWTIVWRGRAWTRSFDEYLQLYHDSMTLNPGYAVIPSIMVDVTNQDRAIKQGMYCIPKLIEVYDEIKPPHEFLLEIDISPTLFFLPESNDPDNVTNWVMYSVEAAYRGLPDNRRCVVKITNADNGAEFQLELAKKSVEIAKEKTAALLIGNRLFDHEGEFEGKKGIAYGGFDLSNANLATLDAIVNSELDVPLVATGNIHSGAMMCEYAIRGCMSGEMHTFFQLPPESYRVPRLKSMRQWIVMRELLFHPDDGIIAVLMKLESQGLLARSDSVLRFRDLPKVYSKLTGKQHD